MENNNKDNRIDFVWYRISGCYSFGFAYDIQLAFASYWADLYFWGSSEEEKELSLEDRENYEKWGNVSPDTLYLYQDPYETEINAYRPFDDMALFANFAEIEAEASSFITWSGKYGALHTTDPYIYPESLDFWIEEHRDLSFALSVWELAVNKDTEKLKRIFKWIDNNTAVEVNYLGRLLIEESEPSTDSQWIKWNTLKGTTVLFDKNNTRSWFSNLCRYPDVIKPAELYIQTVISQKLKDYPLNVEIKSDELGGNLYKTLRPSSLLSAMWYQFFLVFTGEEQIRRCELCGKWEDMRGHRSSWKTHKTCASNERVKRFRKNGEN